MFRISKFGVLTSRFLNLRYDVPICESCMFGTAIIRQFIIKVNKSCSVKKETENKPKSGVSVDQISIAARLSQAWCLTRVDDV